MLQRFRAFSTYLPIHELIYRVFEETGYDHLVSAMPSGETRKANLDMLVVHLYAGSAGAAFAERYSACAVKPSGLGGSANVGMPLDVTFGGKRTVGTAVSADGVITFTPEGGGSE